MAECSFEMEEEEVKEKKTGLAGKREEEVCFPFSFWDLKGWMLTKLWLSSCFAVVRSYEPKRLTGKTIDE